MSAARPAHVGAPHRRYALALGCVFAVVWVALAIRPRYRADWALENALVVVFIAALAATGRRFPLSRISYTLIFLFLCLHEVGAHHTYSEVPYDAWFRAATGRGLNEMLGWQRNHFDRLAHFLFGLLLAYPIREVFIRIADAKGFWAYYLPLDLTMAASMTFELLEWGAAAMFGGDLGTAFLGTQGDEWDAQKDMAAATLGGSLAMLVTAGINFRLQRDFAREWAESLRVKTRRPLGEDAIQRMMDGRDKN